MRPVSFTSAAARQWIKLPSAVRQRISSKVEAFAIGGVGDVKRLKGRDGCRLRVGDYRVIFIENADSIVVVAVGHRREIYD